MGKLTSLKIPFVLVLTILCSSGLHDVVRCIGEDGHSELELSDLEGCFSCIEEDDHDSYLVSAPEDGHCGVCVDIPLSTPTFLKSRSAKEMPAKKIKQLFSLNVVCNLRFVQLRTTSTRLVSQSVRPQLAQLKSTILLI